MPYFFILPAFVLYLALLTAALVGTVLYRPAIGLRPYIAGALLWSSIGFVVSTMAYVVGAVLAVGAIDKVLAGQPSTVGSIAMGGVIFIAPFIAAAAGVLGGTAFGVARRWRKESARGINKQRGFRGRE